MRSVPLSSRGFFACALAVTSAAAAVAFGAERTKGQAEVTFSERIAPILYQHCVVCHHSGDIAPMSLMTYKDARPWAKSIRDAVLSKKMPPWFADPHYGEFLNDARLTAEQIETIRDWVDQGAKEGDPSRLPRAPQFNTGWHIQPDLVIALPADEVAPANGPDEYHYIRVPTNFKQDTWVQAAEVLPGNRRVVHHATVSVVSQKESPSSTPDPAHDKYRYRTGKLMHIRPELPVADDGCALPGGGNWADDPVDPGIVPAIYLPGHLPEVRPEGTAIRIPAGAVLQFQVHYSNRTGKEATDRTSIGFVLAKQPVRREVRQYEIWNNMFAIPPGAANHRVTSCFTLPRDVDAISYTAHMHYRGKSMTTEAFYPDGRREILFSVPRYSFLWQTTYMLKNIHFLPKGTRLETTAYFDNSPNNPLNPDPTRLVRWGEPSEEEMMGFWLSFVEPEQAASASVR
jgi:mono/diheme cytochrome c family protein